MTRYRLGVRLFAASLAGLAGFVDAIGFIKLGGFFVSFMSGNSTRLAVALASGQPPVAAALIGAFVLGVVLGALAADSAPARCRSVVVLSLVTLLLAMAASLDRVAMGLAAGAMAMAMGAENSVFAADGEVHIGLTYMTGTLVKLGQRLAAAMRGGDAWGWAPCLLLWLGLVAGAVVGAKAYALLGGGSLWLAATAALAMTLAALGIGALDGHVAAPRADRHV